jgi:hypothetical protein
MVDHTRHWPHRPPHGHCARLIRYGRRSTFHLGLVGNDQHAKNESKTENAGLRKSALGIDDSPPPHGEARRKATVTRAAPVGTGRTSVLKLTRSPGASCLMGGSNTQRRISCPAWSSRLPCIVGTVCGWLLELMTTPWISSPLSRRTGSTRTILRPCPASEVAAGWARV